MTKKPSKREEIQVTQMMHEKLREELKNNDTTIVLSIVALEKKLGSQIKQGEVRLDGRCDNIIGQIKQVETRLDARCDQIEAQIVQVEARLNARCDQIEAQIVQVEARLNARCDQIEAQIVQVEARLNARFDKMEVMMAKFYTEISKMNAVNARTLALVEEQRAENKTIWDKQTQLEQRFDSFSGSN